MNFQELKKRVKKFLFGQSGRSRSLRPLARDVPAAPARRSPDWYDEEEFDLMTGMYDDEHHSADNYDD